MAEKTSSCLIDKHGLKFTILHVYSHNEMFGDVGDVQVTFTDVVSQLGKKLDHDVHFICCNC